MSLLEYIKRNYKNPNKKILIDLGASEKLIAYLFETPWNTNINVLKGLVSGGGAGSAAVVGTAIVGTDVVG